MNGAARSSPPGSRRMILNVIIVFTAGFMPACMNPLRQIVPVLPPGTIYWVVVIHDDTFLAYTDTVKDPARRTLDSPPTACEWRNISEFGRFVEDELQPRTMVTVLSLEADEPNLRTVSDLLIDGARVLTAFPPPLNSQGQTPEIVAYRDALPELPSEDIR